MPNLPSKLAFSIKELARSTGLGRTFIYDEIKVGRLAVKKAGRRTLVLHPEAERWLTTMPDVLASPNCDKR